MGGLLSANVSVLYEFLVGGGSQNRFCAIRFSRLGKNEGEGKLPEDYGLETEKYRDFWFSVDSSTGQVALGKGSHINKDIVVSMIDTPPGVRGSPEGVALRSPTSTGYWKFPEVQQEDPQSSALGFLVRKTRNLFASSPKDAMPPPTRSSTQAEVPLPTSSRKAVMGQSDRSIAQAEAPPSVEAGSSTDEETPKLTSSAGDLSPSTSIEGDSEASAGRSIIEGRDN